MNSYFVYILANKKYGASYTGVTNELLRRVYEHKKKIFKGFASRYGIDKLVYAEETSDVYAALRREKQIKKWEREWKLELIYKMNPEWKDLYYEYGGTDDFPPLLVFSPTTKMKMKSGCKSAPRLSRTGFVSRRSLSRSCPPVRAGLLACGGIRGAGMIPTSRDFDTPSASLNKCTLCPLLCLFLIF
jgi:putative endonuclease